MKQEGRGAGDGNRTHVSSLGSWGNGHYTTPAERVILQGFGRFGQGRDWGAGIELGWLDVGVVVTLIRSGALLPWAL
jgi:hypothetical protein